MSEFEKNRVPFNRGTGLLIIEARFSNPNGDPDTENDPRIFDSDERGLISPPSFKRKLRDLVSDKDGYAWAEAKKTFQLEADSDMRTVFHNTRRGLGWPTMQKSVKATYDVLETRYRTRGDIDKLDVFGFTARFWDARVFGNTFLESLKDKEGQENSDSEGVKPSKGKKKDNIDEREKRDHFISTGVVQFGPGISVAPVSVVRGTWTSKAGVEEDKDRGLAPLAWRVVRHGVYAMPFFVNPCMAIKSGCGLNDLKLMQFLIPYAYPLNPSVARPHVEVRHAWYAEHKSPLGSCPDSLIIDALTPKKTKGKPDEPSTSIEEYEPIPSMLPEDIRSRLASFEDLCAKRWN